MAEECEHCRESQRLQSLWRAEWEKIGETARAYRQKWLDALSRPARKGEWVYWGHYNRHVFVPDEPVSSQDQMESQP